MAPLLLIPSNFPLGPPLTAGNCEPDDKVNLASAGCRVPEDTGEQEEREEKLQRATSCAQWFMAWMFVTKMSIFENQLCHLLAV